MKKILYTAGLLIFCSATYAQQNNPADVAEIDKPSAPKAVEPPPPAAFTKVDQMPEYPGGMRELQHYLSSNVRYPSRSREKNIQGKVVVRFIIDEEGNVVNETVTHSVSEDIDQEAIRVVKAMPRWTPAIMNGHPVKVYYTLPISFKLGR